MATPTIIRPAMAEAGRWCRGLASVLVAATLMSVTTYVAMASAALTQVNAVRPVALVAAWRTRPASVAPVTELPETTVRQAVAARPFDPRSLNVGAVRAVSQKGEGELERWIAVLSKLGWRDTSTLQNRLYLAAQRTDIPQLLDLIDGLMRRRQAQEQIIPILSLVETDPAMRRDLVRRLAGNPGWRSIYLYSTGNLREPAQLEARFDLLRDLRRRGVMPGRDEIVSNVRAMVAGGLVEQGFALWAASRKGVDRPLNDPQFARAARPDGTSDETVPFEWEVTTGNGFDAGAYAEDGRSALEIQWDGRGVPVFARQRTSALPGRQQLDVDVAAENVGDLSGIEFRLICGDVAYPFAQQTGRPKRFVTDDPVPCGFPILEISGDIQSRAAPRRIELRGLHLTRIGATDAS